MVRLDQNPAVTGPKGQSSAWTNVHSTCTGSHEEAVKLLASGRIVGAGAGRHLATKSGDVL
jgi:hypothetical protein